MFVAVAVVMIGIAFLSGASLARTRIVTVTTTQASTFTLTKLVTTGATAVTTGVPRVKIGQPFSFLGSDKIPVEITFTRLWYADKVGSATADKGYKFAVLDVTVKNVGTKETTPFDYNTKWTVTVDKGYTYDSKTTGYLPYSVRPEEVKTGYVYFEILQDTAAIEIRHISYLWSSIYFILEL